MKHSLLNILLTASLACLGTAAAAPVAAPYQIGTWQGFRAGAVTYTFDDDCPNQYAEAVPMFHAAGLKLTLFTVTGWETNWPAIQNAALWGDEIASHTLTHPNLTTVSNSKLTNELGRSQSIINSQVTKVTNVSCLTIAYPYCAAPDESVTAQYYFAARGCSGQIVPATPPDFLNISSFVAGNTGPYTTGDSLNKLADSAAASGGWCVYLIHAIDGDKGYSPLPGAALQAGVNYTRANPSKFWVETFGNVARYIKERDASSVAEIENTGNNITIQVTNDLPTSIFNYPITIRRPMPSHWPAAAASQNNHPIPAKTVTVESANYLMFDAVPNAGNVILAKSVAP